MVLATIMPLIIGYIYYHKSLFGNAWQNSIGLSDDNSKKFNKPIVLVFALILSFFLSFFLLNFNNSGINQEGDFDNFQHGAWHGTFIAIIVVLPVIVINGYFGRKNWKNMLINLGYWIITLALMGGVIDAMNHWENIIIPIS